MVLMERLDAIEHQQAAPAHAPAAVIARALAKTYAGSDRPAVCDFDLTVPQGEVVALLGPSGCGKTTALRLIAGLERPDAGSVVIGGRVVYSGRTWVAPDRRSIGMVFQDYALFPHLTVRGNIRYGLNRLPRAERRSRMEEVLTLTGLAAYASRYPHELSGGQQQRVAIARAIAPRPAVVLLDEPFSNLDAEMREQVRTEALALLRQAGVSVVLVTHDQDEAFVAADHIAVMSDGRVHQYGTAEELYYQPKTRFVAQFVGIANMLRADRVDGRFVTPLGEFDAPSAESAEACELLLRPEQLEAAPDGVPATVIEREFHGHDWIYALRTQSGEELRMIGTKLVPYDIGEMVHLRSRVRTAPTFPREP